MPRICAGGQDVSNKYGHRAPQLDLPNREWPSKVLTSAPIWMSTDLRDGNQALPNPMVNHHPLSAKIWTSTDMGNSKTMQQKWDMFQLLVAIGFKEIEVSFPCASQTEFDFTRRLIDTPGAIPDDVAIQVITPCREETLKRAVDSLRGAKNAVLFTYIASSDNYRTTILQMTEDEWVERARSCTEYARSITKDDPNTHGTNWTFGFGLEDFANARPSAVLRLCETIKTAWAPSAERRIIFGLASSVEATTPNVFADQVEHFATRISSRDTVTISVHTHNDRGGAIATAELARLAGGDRVEGCLFGNGERAGNMDLVVAALNYLTQGIDPGLDLSNLAHVRSVHEAITGLPVHPRAPYAGDYYFRAFSGAHQDAIRKGFRLRREAFMRARKEGNGAEKPAWKIPYLPLDPADVGQTFDCVVGINSQSGKGGAAWLIHHELGFDIPDGVAAVVSKIAKTRSDQAGRGLAAEEVCALFLSTYFVDVLMENACIFQRKDDSSLHDAEQLVRLTMRSVQAVDLHLSQVLQTSIHCAEVSSHDLSQGLSTHRVAVYVKCNLEESGSSSWGVGIGAGKHEAMARAVISALLVSGQFTLAADTPSSKCGHQNLIAVFASSTSVA